MRKITVCTFMTMDGVIQSPGSPEEDTKNNFQWGGWSAHYWDELMNEAMAKTTAQPYDLLLGRRTYDILLNTEVSTTGVIIASYTPGGEVKTGQMSL